MLAGRTRTRTLRASAAAIAVLAVAAPGALAADPAAPPSITVVGSASRTVVNDTAKLHFRVVTSAPTAVQALDRNSARARRVVAAIKAQGIPAADIRTEDVSVERVRVKPKNRPARVFYRAANGVAVTVRVLSRTARVIDAAVRAGATGVSGIHLSSSRRSARYREALGAAFDDAKAKAQLLADRAGVALGTPLQIEENSQLGSDGGGYIPPGAATSGVPIEPGTSTVTADVTVVFALL